jgi:hypothetical protein
VFLNIFALKSIDEMLDSSLPKSKITTFFKGIYNTYRLMIIALRGAWHLIFSDAWKNNREVFSMIEKNLTEGNIIFEKSQKRRLMVYSIVGVVMFNSAFRTLIGKNLSKKQQKIAQSFTILTAIIDDLCDDYDYSESEMLAVSEGNIQRKDNVWEKIALMLISQIEQVTTKSTYNDLIKKIIHYQEWSKKQIDGTLDENLLREITYHKGGLSIQLNHKVIIGDEYNEKESEAFFGIGVIIQLTNDIFDIFKDKNNNLQTLMTDCKNIDLLRKEYDEVVKNTFKNFTQLPYNQKNIHDFLLQMMVLVSRGWVALDQLSEAQKTSNDIFSPEKYSRKQLVTDMEKVKNLWKAFIYNITAI